MFKNSFSRNNSVKSNPYTSSLSDLLQLEIKGGTVDFKSEDSRDVVGNFARAKKARGFAYLQEGAGVQVPVDGVLVNYSTAADAETALAQEVA